MCYLPPSLSGWTFTGRLFSSVLSIPCDLSTSFICVAFSPFRSPSVFTSTMRSQHRDCSDWLIGELERNISTFDNSTSSLLHGQERAFNLGCTLLREDAESLEARSRSSRSVRQRAREFLKDVFRSLGPEMFLLCTLGPITKLGENASHIRLSTIQNWWNSTAQPPGLIISRMVLIPNRGFVIEETMSSFGEPFVSTTDNRGCSAK